MSEISSSGRCYWYNPCSWSNCCRKKQTTDSTQPLLGDPENPDQHTHNSSETTDHSSLNRSHQYQSYQNVEENLRRTPPSKIASHSSTLSVDRGHSPDYQSMEQNLRRTPPSKIASHSSTFGIEGSSPSSYQNMEQNLRRTPPSETGSLSSVPSSPITSQCQNHQSMKENLRKTPTSETGDRLSSASSPPSSNVRFRQPDFSD